MDQSQFWQIIDGSIAESNDDSDAQIEALASQLRQLPSEEIVSFQHELDRSLHECYTWDLWGASNLLNSGEDEERFESFRGWLISHGSEVFRNALSNPDSLTAFTDPEVDEYEFEEFLMLPRQIFEEITGIEADFEVASPPPSSPVGEKWDFEDSGEAARRLPQLSKQVQEYRESQLASA